MKTVLLTLVGILGAACCVHADSLSNGSFETTDYYVGYGCGDIGNCYFGISDGSHPFPGGPNSFAPWTFTGGSGVALVGSLVHEPGAIDGDQYAFLQFNSTVAQTYAAAPGILSLLTFYLADRTDGYNTGETLTVTAGDQTLTVNNSTLIGTGWNKFSKEFMTSGTGSTTVSFATTGNGSILLDHVSVAAIPEPASMALVSLGLLIPIIVKKRRGRKALSL